jgi:hypothetical protein
MPATHKRIPKDAEKQKLVGGGGGDDDREPIYGTTSG